MPNGRTQIQRLFGLATNIMAKEDEPKPVLAVFRLLNVLTQSHYTISWSWKEQQALISLMSDPMQFDISNVNVRMRVNMLDSLSNITKYHTSNEKMVNRMCQKLIQQIIMSIGEDISALDERPVINLVNSLTKILAQKLDNNQLNRETINLMQSVHNVVSDMAVENSDLVETEFVINYMNSIASIRRRLNKDKTESFIDMFRGKCQDEQVEQYVID